MPNRMIKDSIHDSEKVNAMTDFQFRLWVNLITYVDDFGRGDARPKIIIGKCFPLRERLSPQAISNALVGLAQLGCIVLYKVGDHPYLCFPNWEKHQTIRNKRSKFPAPSDGNLQTIENNCDQLNANVPVIQSNPIQVESNPKSVTRFAPPTREEAQSYYAEINGTFGLDTWLAHYEQNGWMVGKGKMKDWKASMRYWQSKEKPAKKQTMTMPSMDYGDVSAKLDALRAVTKRMKGETADG